MVSLAGCGGQSYDDVLRTLRSSSPDDAAAVFRDADLSAEERFAIDMLCVTTDSVNDTGQPPSAFDWAGAYRRAINPPSTLSIGSVTRSADRLDTTLNLTAVNPSAAARYAQFCLAR